MSRLAVVVTVVFVGCGRVGYDPASDAAAVDATDAPTDADAACRFRSMAMGKSHGCAVNSVGAVYCWGYDRTGVASGSPSEQYVTVPVVVPVPEPVVEVETWGDAACARSMAGDVWCWGAGEGGNGLYLPTVTPLALGGAARDLEAGRAFMCAIIGPDDHVACWGYNLFHQLGIAGPESSPTPVAVPGAVGAVELAVGHHGACARLGDGRVRCWGYNSSGQLGLGFEEPATAPTDNAALAGADQLVMAGRHSCALDGGEVRCWGRNQRGELGDSAGNRSTPGAVIRRDVAALVTSARSSCALDLAGTVACWGQNRAGELGNGDLAPRATPTPVPGLSGVRALAAGAHQVCAEVAGTIVCWGENREGALGRGSRTVATMPVAVPGVTDAAELAVTGETVCARTVAGAMSCWGTNEFGQLGRGSFAGSSAPVQVFASGIRAMGAGGGQVCAVDGQGLLCWGIGWPGDGRFMQLLDTPARSILDPSVTAVGVGADFACAIVAQRVRCWGANNRGQLGVSTAVVESTTPIAIEGDPQVDRLTVGFDHACARLISTQGIVCWGANDHGQLGVNLATDPVTPTPVVFPGGVTVRQVAAARQHTCAITSDDALWCWGENESGQLGSPAADQLAPLLVPGLTAPLAIATRFDTSCASLADGRTLCFGANAYGSIGDGNGGSGATPRRFGTQPFSSIAGAFGLQCGIAADRTVWCAGTGSQGALGPALVTATPAPVAVPCE